MRKIEKEEKGTILEITEDVKVGEYILEAGDKIRVIEQEKEEKPEDKKDEDDDDDDNKKKKDKKEKEDKKEKDEE